MSAAVAVAPRVVREDRFPVATVAFADGVIAYPGLEYANLIGYRPLRLDLYRRGGPVTGRRQPLIIYVHGGGWRRGDSRTLGAFADLPALLASIAAQGDVVAAVNYRLSGAARFPAAVQDLDAAIEYLRLHARRYGIDPSRVILWGASAGAHLAALASTACRDPRFAPPLSTGRLSRRQAAEAVAPRVSHCVSAVVTWYGLFDLGPLTEAGGHLRPIAADVRAFLGCQPGDCARVARLASPLTYVSPRTPPMLLLHGTADTEVPERQTRTMAAALRKAHVPVEVHYIEGANHGWIGHSAAATRHASRQALRWTLRFIGSVTDGAPRAAGGR